MRIDLTPAGAADWMSVIGRGRVFERRATLYIAYADVMNEKPNSEGSFSAHFTIGSRGKDLAQARSRAACMWGVTQVVC